MIPDKMPFIVLIDDDEDDLDMLSSALQIHGFRVKTFNAGHHAIESLKAMATVHDLPELIILDYNMPRLNGEQVLNLLKSEDSVKSVPVFIYSTCLSEVCQNALVAMGAHGALVKSGNYHEFTFQVLRFKETALSFIKATTPDIPRSGF